MNISKQEQYFNDLIIHWNKKINIVSRKKENVYDLITDSKIFLDYITDDVKNVLDLGTGGGFPGIVIKINRPDLDITLVDSVKKKINVVCDIIEKLELHNVQAVWSRAEELHTNIKYKKQFDVIVSRSVAELKELIKWSKELVRPKGLLLTLKGTDISKELSESKKLKLVSSIQTYQHEDRIMIKCVFK